MATVKPFLDTRYKRKDNTYQIIIRIRHGSQVRDMPTGWKVEQAAWRECEVTNKHPDARIINSLIDHMISQAKQYIAECQLHNRPLRLDMIGKQNKSYSLNDYLLHRATQYAKKEMYVMERKVRRYDRELRVFKTPGLSFRDLLDDERNKRELRGNHVYFDEITQDTLRDFETFLTGLGNVNNTRHKKYEFLGKFYTDAVNDGKATDPNPFKKYKIQTKPVKKEKLTETEVKAIEELPLKPGAVNDARNLWLFSYYCKGNRFEICVTTRRDMIAGGRVLFRTNKGNKYVSVKIHSRLKAIIDRYPGDSEFLFPYVKTMPPDKKRYLKMIDSLNVIVNRNLKIVASLAGISKAITFHIARHTFAFHLKKVTTNLNVVQESLGHSRQSTTMMYLKNLDDEFLDGELDKLYG